MYATNTYVIIYNNQPAILYNYVDEEDGHNLWLLLSNNTLRQLSYDEADTILDKGTDTLFRTILDKTLR